MGFYDNVKVAQNKSADNLTYTDNGAVVYSSIGSEMVDFSFSVNSLRNKSEKEICERIAKAYAESPELATKMMFQIGDIREGKGERHIFNSCMKFMAIEHPEILKELMPLIPEYTRWDYAIELAISENKEIASAARKMVVAQIKEDQKNLADGKSISLCAKWMPSIQSKKEEDRKLALKLEKALKLDHKGYRKLLSELREKLNIIERKQSLKQEITREDLSNMSSKALLKYSAGMSKDETFQEFMQDVAEGKETINAGVLTPSDVVHKYIEEEEDWYHGRSVRPYDIALENMWDNLKDTIDDKALSTIVVRDGSGSMTCKTSNKTSMTCLEVATALSIYCAEKMPGDLKDKFITFSSRPEVVDMSRLNTLHDKLKLCYQHNDCTNTDLKKTFDLLLDTLKRGKISQEEAPKNILILSDMQFDHCHTLSRYGYRGEEQLKPLFDTIREEWAEAGYKLPTLVFWQLNVEKAQYPEVDNELGIVYVSGYNTENLDLVLSGELAQYTPEKQLEIILSNERYDAIGIAFREGLRKEQGLATRVNDRYDVIDMPTGYEEKQERQTPNRDEQII